MLERIAQEKAEQAKLKEEEEKQRIEEEKKAAKLAKKKEKDARQKARKAEQKKLETERSTKEAESLAAAEQTPKEEEPKGDKKKKEWKQKKDKENQPVAANTEPTPDAKPKMVYRAKGAAQTAEPSSLEEKPAEDQPKKQDVPEEKETNTKAADKKEQKRQN